MPEPPAERVAVLPEERLTLPSDLADDADEERLTAPRLVEGARVTEEALREVEPEREVNPEREAAVRVVTPERDDDAREALDDALEEAPREAVRLRPADREAPPPAEKLRE